MWRPVAILRATGDFQREREGHSQKLTYPIICDNSQYAGLGPDATPLAVDIA